jgi:hypothetical protein
VLAVTPQSVRQRFTLKSADAADSQGPSVQTAMRAMVDDPLDFDLAPDGSLVGLPGWDAFKTRLLAKLDQSLPASDPVRGRTHEMLDGDPADTAQRLVIGDTQAMAASQAAARRKSPSPAAASSPPTPPSRCRTPARPPARCE